MLLVALVALTLRPEPAEIPFTNALGISGVSQGGRIPISADAVQAQIVRGQWKAPHAGDKLTGPRGEREWTKVDANKDGVFEGPATQGGYIYAEFDSPEDKPMVLVATGDTTVYVDGEPRAGDPYGYGWLELPVMMHKGKNGFLFSCGRGALKATLKAPPKPLYLNLSDLTTPDVVVGQTGNLDLAIPVVNCTDEPQMIGLSMPEPNGAHNSVTTAQIPPMTVVKCWVFFPAHGQAGETLTIPIDLFRYEGARATVADHQEIKIAVKRPTDHYKSTFVSGIDGSIQYYAVAPSLKPSKDNALILTVHGASVEATNQANAYKSKDWCTVVAATNRRPYGFDWEDWGRMDAMEVWDEAKRRFPHDPERQILTGHSMGGHGTWQIGLTYPNEFAAIGPSAGWISFWSYAGGWDVQNPNPVEAMLRRSMNQSDSLLMLPNVLNEDLYILHGDKDDNVPVEQAREMKRRIEGLGVAFTSAPSDSATGRQYVYHEQPGAGHWWGDQCVDWPAMFDLFAHARLHATPDFSFTTINPAVSSTYGGVTILQQTQCMLPSKVEVKRDVRGIAIGATNVAALTLSPKFYADKLDQITIEGTALKRPSKAGADLTVHRTPQGWKFTAPVAATEKNPARSGPFKRAFANDFFLVVATHGTPEENAWARAKARFDAEQWYYRGNGVGSIITDDQAFAWPKSNLILYGHAGMNSAWKLLAHSPIKVTRGKIDVGGHAFAGDDEAVLFLYPEGPRLIGVVAGSGMTGLRLCDRLPYFTSGVAYPDWTVVDASALDKGTKGVRAAGFFDNRWKFDPKQSAFLP